MTKRETEKTKRKPGPKGEFGRLRGIANAEQALTMWNEDPHLNQIMSLARQMRKSKHGLYSSIPILCKGDDCPYKGSCFFWKNGAAPVGDKCPIEIAAIEDLFERYCKELNIDPDNPKNAIDVMMVKDIVDIDINILRCDNKMALTADFIIENVVGVTDKGQAVYKQELHPLLEHKERLGIRKNKNLQLLNSTRKDKEGSRIHIELDPSEKAAEMMRLQRELKMIDQESSEQEESYFRKSEKPKIIDVEPIDFE